MRAGRLLWLIAALGAVASVAGCGGTRPRSAAHLLGRGFGGESVVVRAAPRGDPLPERGGSVSRRESLRANALAPHMASATPQAALYRYALAYTNWSASSPRERELAALSVGPARSQAQQSAASESEAAVLAKNRVANHGVVLALSEGDGPARGWWVVVTEERTIGTGPYAGLPEGPHVTLARVERVEGGWAVAAWSPLD